MDYIALKLASLATDMTAASTVNKVGAAVLKQNMDVQEEMGAEMIKMMENSVTPNLGANVDVRL